MNKKRIKLKEMSGYDELKMQAIDRFREQDPMTLSDSELRSAIDYMLAYRWALEGDEDVLNDYIEASKLRNKNESRYINKKLIRLTEQDLHRIVKESIQRVLREEKPWKKPSDEYMTNPFDAKDEGEFNFINQTNKINNDVNARLAIDSHNQVNSPYGKDAVMAYDYNSPSGREQLEKWHNMRKGNRGF